jgi:aminoglycoside phosphotransferase (APT) family kinase protein
MFATVMLGLLNPSQWVDVSDGLRRYAALPEWLTAATQSERVIAALSGAVPEFASGTLTARACKVKHAGLDDASGCWAGDYHITIENPQSEQKQTVVVHGTLFPPGAPRPTTPKASEETRPFGADRWRCYLPELYLELQACPPEPELEALPMLADPEQARMLLEQSIRASAPAYHDLRIQACEPELMRSRAGERYVFRYHLEYPQALADRSWPTLLVAKTYNGELGQNAYNSMRALWESPLGRSAMVAIAEPLAYLPTPRVLVQGPIQEEQTLEDMVESAMRTSTPEAIDKLREYICKAAIGLAELHRSGVSYGRTFTWQDRLAQARAALDGLAGPLPEMAEAAAPMLAHLEAIAADEPPDRLMPTHGAFRAAQVLIHQGQIGFIDFDGFCQAEPAMDLARFLATTKDVGLDAVFDKQAGDDPMTEQRRLQTLIQLEELCAAFLEQYEQLAPVSRKRVALWETLNTFTLVMSCWKKIKPMRLKNTLLMLERQLSASGLY